MDPQQQSFANIKSEDGDFEKYLERELGKLTENTSKPPATPPQPAKEDKKEASEKDSTATESPKEPPTKPATPVTTPALSAFPPKPKPALLVTIPPSPLSKKAPAAAPTPAGAPPKYQPPIFKPIASRPNPLRMSVLPDRRPMTGSTRRLSFSSMATTRRPIKYGKGKHARVELVPQPSDDDEDPLNWPRWKKEANYWTLLLLVALTSVMKTAFVSVNSQLATGYAVSYTAAAALTGVPLMLSALTGLVSLVAARIWGKRPVYLAATAVIFIGAMWNMNVAHSFGQCMAARVFQGLGWGAVDVLVLGSIHDTYFEHERYLRTAVYDVVAVGATWGGPLLGGVVSSHSLGFSMQYQILGSFMAIAAVLLAVAAPETAYDRSFYSINTPVSAWSNKELPLRPRMNMSVETVREYLQSRGLRPRSYKNGAPSATDRTVLLQAPRAMAAPTTVLLALVTLLPFCALWGMTESLSLFFSPLPFALSTASTGALLLAPWMLATAVVAAAGSWPRWQRRFSTTLHVAAVGGGSLLVFVGLLALGLYVASCTTQAVAQAAAAHASVFTVGAATGGTATLSLPAVSFVLGLLAAGAHALDATVRPVVRRSTQFTSSNLATAQRNTVDMCAGVALWRTLVVGAFVVAMPNAVWFWALLKATSVGIVVTQVLVAAAAAAAWWRYDESIRRLDGQVMRCVDLGMLKRTGSFFDTD